MTHTLHLIANAHLDPAWLWDWREGLNEGLITCRAVLDLMDADPELTFIRGEASIYEHVEREEPLLFARIKAYVEAGRWDVVGGTYVQPDTNLPATETLSRQFTRGQTYFRSRFGLTPRVAWIADSFGHSAGLPEILAAAGMEGIAFTRPTPWDFALESPLFWWEAASGARVLAYRPPVGWYGTDRDEMTSRLDAVLASAGSLQNVGVFYGVGNHGGGPTRRHLAEIREWAAAHPDVKIVFSGLHRLFDALREEASAGGLDLPTLRGELNFCLRGCYVSAAKTKFLFRQAEVAVSRAETTSAAIGAAFGAAPVNLGEAWDAVLFNAFHDILPGTSIERTLDEQNSWLGGAVHQAKRAELTALNALARQVDTSVPTPGGDHPSAVAFLVWNPHLFPVTGPVDLEAGLDARPIFSYQDRPDALPVEVRGPDGLPLPFQVIESEHNYYTHVPWRKRVVVPMTLPPLGWSVVTVGWVESPETVILAGVPASAPSDGVIENGTYRAEAAVGERGIQIAYRGRKIFGDAGLSAVTVEDPWGSWGGISEEPASLDLSTVRHDWTITEIKTLEAGPERASLWVRLTGGSSRLELTFSLSREREAVDVAVRVFWNERAARLKLVMPGGDHAEFDVPGGSIERGPCGEVPGSRWVRVHGQDGAGFGFASDALYGFDAKDGVFRASVVRATRYGSDRVLGADAEQWRPALDTGELRFRFLLSPGDAALPRLAAELEQPPITLLVLPTPGPLPRIGSLAALTPETVKLLALKPAEDKNGWIIRVQNLSGSETAPVLTWQGQALKLGAIPAHAIATWRLILSGSVWSARRTDTTEK